MSVPNQITIKVEERDFNDGNTFARMHIDAMSAALKTLTGGGYALWTYIASNQNNYQFDLSKQACVNFGFSESTYKRAKKELIEKGFLTPINEGSSIYVFHEYAAEGVQNELGSKMNSQKVQNDPPKVQNEPEGAQNEQRNTTDTTYTTIYTTENFSSSREEELAEEGSKPSSVAQTTSNPANLPVFYLLFPGVGLEDLISMGKARQIEDNIYEVTKVDGSKTLVRER